MDCRDEHGSARLRLISIRSEEDTIFESAGNRGQKGSVNSLDVRFCWKDI